MPRTHGGPRKSRQFSWSYDPVSRCVNIENERGRILVYRLEEIRDLMLTLQHKFGKDWFPLGNNVALLTAGTEQPGLGMTLLSQRPGDTTYAQGASYLGVILEEVGFLQWNEKHRGIRWRVIDQEVEKAQLERRLTRTQ